METGQNAERVAWIIADLTSAREAVVIERDEARRRAIDARSKNHDRLTIPVARYEGQIAAYNHAIKLLEALQHNDGSSDA